MLRFRALGFALVLALAASALSAQIAGWSSDGMGSTKDPTQKAVEAYGRGVQAKHKAEAATDPAKKAKLYAKAKDELTRSLGFAPTPDAYLDLGQIFLAEGNAHAALTSCAHAQSLKPANEEVKACVEQAQREDQKADQKAQETPAPSPTGQI
jgi:hypothetical protein